MARKLKKYWKQFQRIMNTEEQPISTDNPSTEQIQNESDNTINETEQSAPGQEDIINSLKLEIAELNQKHIYQIAEFENFRRRSAKERLELIKNASKDLIVDLLPVLDDFERGLESMQQATEVDAVAQGVQLIYNKFRNILIHKGLEAIPAVGASFDVELHEAISKQAAINEDQKNTVLFEVEKGYKLNETIIRYAKVIVAE